MMVTFQSTAAPNVVMLRDLAQYLLGLIGLRLDTRGVILHDELSGAIRCLEAAITDEEKSEFTLDSGQSLRGRNMESGSGLSQRAWPFLDMMRQAHRQNADIIWGL
ncbi:hypothetical protein LMG28688_07127 [Paraburkholderia caffeinitolerans]|uniref:DUF1840 domain-containing protein n=1 Tax=Paraburkholderia caffeinitolerans TaxID=1723730 RepID=A0A6J5H3U1_9BURK|nr:DUF1840 domain-containing protein [Paraburkholderia caffeinitolerans]CAB3810030.1 hypothetical protein LMG28688_07127 [Paraburkholderia caffeinitolerans]